VVKSVDGRGTRPLRVHRRSERRMPNDSRHLILVTYIRAACTAVGRLLLLLLLLRALIISSLINWSQHLRRTSSSIRA